MEFIRCTAIKRKEKLRFLLEAKWNKPQKNLRSKIEDYCFIHFSLVSLSRDVYCLWYELFLFARARESSRKVGARSDPSPTSLRFSERINFAMLAISKNLRQIRGSPRTTRWNYLFILSVWRRFSNHDDDADSNVDQIRQLCVSSQRPIVFQPEVERQI